MRYRWPAGLPAVGSWWHEGDRPTCQVQAASVAVGRCWLPRVLCTRPRVGDSASLSADALVGFLCLAWTLRVNCCDDGVCTAPCVAAAVRVQGVMFGRCMHGAEATVEVIRSCV